MSEMKPEEELTPEEIQELPDDSEPEWDGEDKDG